MTRLAQITTLTGVGLGEAADLDEAQLAALIEVADEEQKRRSWSNETELLAQAVDRLGVIAARLEAGVRVGFPKDGRIPAPHAPEPVKRPDWYDQPQAATAHEVVMTPREFFASQARKG